MSTVAMLLRAARRAPMAPPVAPPPPPPPPPDTPGVTLSAAPSAAAIAWGGTLDVVITATRTAFGGALAYTVSGVPATVTATFVDPTTNTITLRLTPAAEPPTPEAVVSATLVVTATGTGIAPATLSLALTVTSGPYLALSVTSYETDRAQPLTFLAGDTVPLRILGERVNGGSGAVAVETVSVPAGATVQTLRQRIQGTTNSTELWFTTPADATPGPATLTLRATGGGLPAVELAVPVTVVAPAPFIRVRASSPGRVLEQGRAIVCLVRAQGVRYSGTRTPGITGLPTGVTAAWDAVGADTWQLTLTASPTATTGLHEPELVFTGTGGVEGRDTLRLVVCPQGPFARFHPLTHPPLDYNGVALVFNVTTGVVEGDVVNWRWLTPAFIRDPANFDTIVSVRTSGGTYPMTAAGLQAALDFAAVPANGRVLIVVESKRVNGTILTGSFRPRSKGTFAASARTVITSSDLYDGTWEPPTVGYHRSAAEQDHCFWLQGNLSGTATVFDASTEWNVHRYACAGMYIRRNPERLNALANAGQLWTYAPSTTTGRTAAEMPQELIFRWCVVNGEWSNRDNGNRQTPSGWWTEGTSHAFINGMIYGIAGYAQESKAVLAVGVKYLEIRHTFLEGASMAMLTGGALPKLGHYLEHVLIDQVYTTKRQAWNERHPSYVSGVGGTGPASLAVKQGIECKVGWRMWFTRSILENNFAGSQKGTAISFQVANTFDSAVFRPSGEQCAFLNRCIGQGTFITGYQARGVIMPPNEPTRWRQFTGNDFRCGVEGEDRNGDISELFSMGDPGDAPSNLDYGPVIVSWNSFINAGMTRVGLFGLIQQFRRLQQRLSVHDNILPMLTGDPVWLTTDNTGGTNEQALDALNQWGTWSLDRNAMNVRNAASRAALRARFPGQDHDRWWMGSLEEYGFVAPNARPTLGNWRLAAGSRLKGQGEHGADPGCDHDLLDGLLASVRGWVPPEIVIPFAETP